MAITQRGSLTSDSSVSTTPTVNKPTGVVAGDVEIALQFCSSAAPSLLSGWANIVNVGPDIGTAYSRDSSLVAGGSEPSGYTFTQGAAAQIAALIAFSGVNNSTPTEQAGSDISGTPAVPSVTPTLDGSVQIIIYGSDGGTAVASDPSGGTGTYTKLGEIVTGSVGSMAVYMRAFGAGTGGTTITAPPTAITWAGGQLTRTITTFVLVPAGGGGASALIESEWHPTEPQTNPLTISVW